MVREKSRGLTADYRVRADAEILTRFLCYPIFQQVDSIFCYVHMKGEPSTREIIETAWQMGKLVAVPRCIPGPAHRMEAVQITSWEDLQEGTYGILEPQKGLPVIDAYKLAMAVIPCVAADRHGHRLGHGAGYYDRWLQGQTMYKYCLCYGELLLPEVPTDPYDVIMDRVITEDGIYNPRLASEAAHEGEKQTSIASELRTLLQGLLHR